MKLTILGSGCSWPNPNRRESAFLVQEGDLNFLVDAGEGCTESLVRFGFDWTTLDAALLTHFHNDHVAGLIPLLFRMYIYANRERPLRIYGPPDLDHFMKMQTEGLADWLDEMPFEVITRVVNDRDSSQVTPTFSVQAFEVEHKKVSLGYRLESEGKVLAFSGDTNLCDALYDLAANADVFVCETGKPDNKDHENHLSWSQIGQVAAKAGVKKLVLTHFDRHFNDKELLTTTNKLFSNEIVLAEDGMTIRI